MVSGDHLDRRLEILPSRDSGVCLEMVMDFNGYDLEMISSVLGPPPAVSRLSDGLETATTQDVTSYRLRTIDDLEISMGVSRRPKTARDGAAGHSAPGPRRFPSARREMVK